jgi:hypothetical protein
MIKILRLCPLGECSLLQLIVRQQPMDLLIDEGDFDAQQVLFEVPMAQIWH